LWINFVTPSPIHRGRGIVFDRFLSLFISLFVSFFLSFFLCFFVSKITRNRLDRFAWNFQGRCGVTMEQSDSIFGQFRETARCRDEQHGDGVCCTFAPQLVFCCYFTVLWLIVDSTGNKKSKSILSPVCTRPKMSWYIAGNILNIIHLQEVQCRTVDSTLSL